MKVEFKILIFIILFFLICFCFLGCASYFYPERELYAGEEITPDQLFEISKELAESKALAESEKAAENTEEVTEPFIPDTDDMGNILVYWTDNGSVWHINLKCPSLSRSVKVESGTENTAITKGKERLCKKCGELIAEENTSKE